MPRVKRALACFIATCAFWLELGPGLALASAPADAVIITSPSVPTITLCVDPDWPPYEWLDAGGRYYGIGADLVRKIGRFSGVDFDIVPTQNWPDSLAAAQAGRCQGLALLNHTPERAQWLSFTEPFFNDTNVLITRQDVDDIPDLSALQNVRVVLPQGTSIEQHIRATYPNLEVLTVASEIEAVHAVNEGRADIAIRSLSVAAWTLRSEGLFALKIAGELPGFPTALRMGIVGDNPALVERLNRGIARLSQADVQQAINKYIAIEAYRGIDYRQQWLTLAIALVIVSTSLFWAFRLRRLNQTLRQRENDLAASQTLLRKALDEEYQANLEQHQFMSMVAHEFRTPLSVMESSCDLLELKLPPDFADTTDLRGTIHRQREATRYLTEMVNRSLDADRSIQTAWQRNAAMVNSEELLERALGYAQVLNPGTHTIKVQNHGGAVPGDLELLTRMLNNLVENALKYSPPGATITLEASQNNTHVFLSVTDNGPGIPAERQSTIFGKYQRGDHNDIPGLGLGLYMVRRIAQLHNGDVTLESLPGKTRFTITLPKSHDGQQRARASHRYDDD